MSIRRRRRTVKTFFDNYVASTKSRNRERRIMGRLEKNCGNFQWSTKKISEYLKQKILTEKKLSMEIYIVSSFPSIKWSVVKKVRKLMGSLL